MGTFWTGRSVIRATVAAIAAISLAGCAISRDGPREKVISQEAADIAGFTLVQMSAPIVRNYMVAKTEDTGGTTAVPAAPPVSLSSGDVLRVRISETKEGGLFAPLALGGTVFDNLRVDHRGSISLPHAGRIKVAGLDPQRVETRIRTELEGVAFDPQVQVEVTSDRGSSVLVSGEVKGPGRFSLIDSPLTLVDAIARAGGAAKPAHLTDVIIRRGKAVRRIPLETVLNGNNQQLRAGDEVTLVSSVKVFNALGAVKRGGQLEFPKSNPSLMDALAQAGGLDDIRSSATGVFVFRLREPKAWLDENNKWRENSVIFRFDMSKPEMMFIAQAFAIQNDDTIFVTNAPSVEWVRTLQPIAMTIATVGSTVASQSALQNQLLSGN
jgi:polysaccharide export outer membrane protein